MQKIEEIKSVSIIGAGNVGWHMARAMFSSGIEIFHIISRSPEKTYELADSVSALPAVINNNFDKVPDLFLICVSDDAISELVEKFRNAGALLAHTSGSTGLEVFGDSSSRAGVFYPLQTFKRSAEMNYGSIPFLIEGGSKDVESKLLQLAGRISEKCVSINSEKRRKVHLAAVFACNFSNHMISIAQAVLQKEGLEIELLKPLLEETFNKIQTLDPLEAQTGPAQREDLSIIALHLEALGSDTYEHELYKLLSNSIIRYKSKHE